MFSCVFGSEFINLVGFFGCHCLTPVSPFTLYEVKAAQKHSRRSGPCLLSLITIMIFNLSCFSHETTQGGFTGSTVPCSVISFVGS